MQSQRIGHNLVTEQHSSVITLGKKMICFLFPKEKKNYRFFSKIDLYIYYMHSRCKDECPNYKDE